MNKFFLVFIALTLVSFSCKKTASPVGESGEETIDSLVASGVYTSPKTYNLNVVYLYPQGSQPLNEYHKRLSGVVSYIQQYVGEEMILNGFGNQTFGLLRDSGDSTLIKIIAIEGSVTSYSKNGGGGGAAAVKDVKDYFAAHPQEESSAHTLIFIPSLTGEHGWDMNTGSVLPFNGTNGTWCLVVDYLNFDMKHFRTGTQEGDALKVGSVAHELMHALKVPHERETYPQNGQWEDLMSGGGGQLSKIASANKIHISKAAAAMLDVCQVVVGNGEFYSSPAPTLNIEVLTANTNAANDIELSVKAISDVAVKHLAVYADELPAGVNSDYDALAWHGAFNLNTQATTLTIPVADFYPASITNSPYEMRLVFLHEDGSQTTRKVSFSIINGVPDININLDRSPESEFSKTGWVVTASSEELTTGSTQGPKENLLDNDITTFWHSKWSSPASVLPQYFTVDMLGNKTVSGLSFYQRQANANGQYSQVHVKKYKLETSTDNFTWTDQGEFTLMSDVAQQKLRFVTPKNFRYFRITVFSVYSSKTVVALSEVGVF